MPRRHAPLALLLLPGITGMFLGLLSGFVPQDEGRALRRTASSIVYAPRSEDLPAPIVSSGDGLHTWSIRGPVSRETMHRALPEANEPISEEAVLFVDGGVSLSTGGEPVDFDDTYQALETIALLPQTGDGQTGLLGMQPHDYGDSLDASGHPMRWTTQANLYKRPAPKAVPETRREEKEVEYPLDPTSLASMAGPYRNLVQNFAKHYELDQELIYAIIHSESDFSPTLTSRRSAAGLMQLLPSTASDEIHRYLYGHPGRVTGSDLQRPETNIRYGTTYLHILLTRYFQGVHDPTVREYCAVAAYNMGPNRFLRLYGQTNEEAVERINRKSPEAFYEELTKKLPLSETRSYVAKVRRLKDEYQNLMYQ
ncbi:MAG: transglycosylase SLT domain-containing protein [Desulfovibrio sp.]|jgi:membrane-bound lytic murein transglycosylase C|nr:transglycosylase SLT domain-containing protein [Desulfovibrio sp.]